MPDELNNEALTLSQEDIDTVDDPVEEVVEEVEQEPDAEEVEETEEAEVAGDDEEVVDDGETETEQDDEELDFVEWAKQYGELPESIKSEEDLLQAYQSMLPEMKRGQTDSQKLQQLDALLKAQGIDGGVSDFLSGNLPQRQQTAQPKVESGSPTYFDQSATKSIVDSWIKEGRIRNTDQTPGVEESYRSVANLVDAAYGPQLQKVEEVYTVMGKALTDMRNQVRDMMWNNLPAKTREGVNRSEIDKLMERGLFDSYEKAVNFYAFSNPNVLKTLAEKSEEAGRTKERKKLKKNRGALRKNKTPNKSRAKWQYDRYINADGTWNDAKLNQLPIDQQVKMLEDFERENFSKR